MNMFTPGPPEANLTFHRSRDGRMCARLNGGKVVLLHFTHHGQVKDRETWRVRLHHRETFCLAYPLERVEDDRCRMNGKIVTVVLHKGYFFIRGEDGNEYFAHISTLELPRMFYDLRLNDHVVFEGSHGRKGPIALRVEYGAAVMATQTSAFRTQVPSSQING
jgi:cold shock CspA family protein